MYLIDRNKLWSIPGSEGNASANVNVPFKSLVVVCLLITLSVIVRYGMETEKHELFAFAASMKHLGQYTVDPITATFIPQTAPPLSKIFINFYDVPIFHFISGIITKFLIACAFLVLTWKVTQSVLACFLAQIMLFGLFEFLIIDMNIPIGTMSHGIRKPLFFSYRQLGTLFGITATIFFIDKRFLICSLFLAFGFYLHPFNIVAFYLSLVVALVISFLLKKGGTQYFFNLIKLSLPFLILIFPYVWSSGKIFTEINPIPSSLWWKFLLKNEPDDVSILFHLSGGAYIKEFFLTILAAVLYVCLKCIKPITQSNLSRVIRSEGDLILPLLFAPWCLVLLAVIWESMLIDLVPDFLNDIFIPLQFRRMPSISGFFYIPVLAAIISSLVLVFTEITLMDLFGWGLGTKGRSFMGDRFRNFSIDKSLGITFSVLLVLFVTIRGSSQGIDFQKYWNFDHQRDKYFLMKSNSPVYPIGGVSSNNVIPFIALQEVCQFIRANTNVRAAFFNPTYIGWFRATCERQGFLSEKDDGGFALYNRKLATIYLKRFSDIHNGLTYDDLPGVVFVGGEPYEIMRQRYLSLDISDIERLKELYPGYQYFLTEVGHNLPYKKIYANDYFLIYDILQ